jgi:DNA-binding SARP family transcriptional activator
VVARLSLLGGFVLESDDGLVNLAGTGQRLVALLAVRGQPVRRVHVAGCLWPDHTDERASANLRAAIWRLRDRALLVEPSPSTLGLDPRVRVDIADVIELARELEAAAGCPAVGPSLDLLTRDLLPDWYDDWLVVERERLRQVRLHALECLGRAWLRLDQASAAIEAALAAVAAEPLRESSHRLLIEVHLHEGNWGEAVRQYDACCALLRDELGVGPSDRLRQLIDSTRPDL